MASIGFKRGINPMSVAGDLIKGIVGLWVCSIVVGVLNSVVNASNTTDPFYLAYGFIGLGGGTGIITIAGIFIALSILRSVVDIQM